MYEQANVAKLIELSTELLDTLLGTTQAGNPDILKYIYGVASGDLKSIIELWTEFSSVGVIEPHLGPEVPVDLTRKKGHRHKFAKTNYNYAEETCDVCFVKDTLKFFEKTNELVCTNCACSTDLPIAHNRREWADFRSFTRVVKYYRVVNMKSILRNLQAYPSPLTPRIREFIKENRPNRGMTIKSLRRKLLTQKVKVSYTMAPNILSCINPDYKPLRLTAMEREDIVNAFRLIAKTFEDLKAGGESDGRKNFLNYHYALLMISRRLKIEEKLRPHLLLPKGIASSRKHSILWKRIEIIHANLGIFYDNGASKGSLQSGGR